MTTLPDDICIVASYYNPTGSRVRWRNLRRFHASLRRAGIPVYYVELMFGREPSQLHGYVPYLYKLRTDSVLWQKERLLNRLIALLPRSFTKVAWVDVDLLFGRNPRRWLTAVSTALDHYSVVQGFARVHRRARLPNPFDRGDVVESFALRRDRSGAAAEISSNYHDHGHTGYAWGARRELLEQCGLYDCCLSGSGDHLMAHAFAGDLDSDCFNQVFRGNNAYRDHFMDWAAGVAARTGGAVGYVDCELTHLWHGSPAKRKYRERDVQLTESLFDPARDLRLGSPGCWEWSASGRRFVSWSHSVFEARQEP